MLDLGAGDTGTRGHGDMGAVFCAFLKALEMFQTLKRSCISPLPDALPGLSLQDQVQNSFCPCDVMQSLANQTACISAPPL
jgi:hypothetical protein